MPADITPSNRLPKTSLLPAVDKPLSFKAAFSCATVMPFT